jgi:hypothetical protein
MIKKKTCWTREIEITKIDLNLFKFQKNYFLKNLNKKNTFK